MFGCSAAASCAGADAVSQPSNKATGTKEDFMVICLFAASNVEWAELARVGLSRPDGDFVNGLAAFYRP